MLCEGEVASVCYGVFPGGNQYEAHVKTLSGFGERGYAKLVATAYVLHCVENQFRGVWCCDHDHRASYRIVITWAGVNAHVIGDDEQDIG